LDTPLSVAKVLIVITKQRKKLNSLKYVNVKLGRDAFAFPLSSRQELRQLLSDAWILESDINDEKLEQKNIKYLTRNNLNVIFDSNIYITSVYDEFLVLSEWYHHGVSEEEKEEFHDRLINLTNELGPKLFYLFDTLLKETITDFFEEIKTIKYTVGGTSFTGKTRNLIKIEKEISKHFKERVIELLRKPRDIEEIIRITKVNPSNARRWLMKLETEGVITKTRKRQGLGRPKNIYYLSQRLK
jgi:predicted transcriptional regulator